MTLEQALEIIQKHGDRFRARPASYRVLAQGGKPEGWVAHVELWEARGDHTNIHKVWSATPSRRHETKERADIEATILAATWLRENGDEPAVGRESGMTNDQLKALADEQTPRTVILKDGRVFGGRLSEAEEGIYNVIPLVREPGRIESSGPLEDIRVEDIAKVE